MREAKANESEKNFEGNDLSQALTNRYDFVKRVNRQHRDAVVRNRNSARALISKCGPQPGSSPQLSLGVLQNQRK